jgi:hypothetical protein
VLGVGVGGTGEVGLGQRFLAEAVDGLGGEAACWRGEGEPQTALDAGRLGLDRPRGVRVGF